MVQTTTTVLLASGNAALVAVEGSQAEGCGGGYRGRLSVAAPSLPVIPCPLPGFIPWLSCQESTSEDRMNPCVKAFQERTQRYKEEQQALNWCVANTRPLKPICSEDTVLWVLHEYAKKYHPLTLGKASTESANQLQRLLFLDPHEIPAGHCAAGKST